MSNFFEQLEAQLYAAARVRARGRRGFVPALIGRLGRGTRALVPIVAAVLLIAAVGAAILAAGHGHAGGHPSAPGPPGPNQISRELPYIRAADRHAFRNPTCHAHQRMLPAVSDGSPSGAVLSILGVLRRPATKADRLPRSVDVARGVYVHYVRLARVKNGVSYYVVPAEPTSLTSKLPAGCARAAMSALRSELPRIPGALRAPTLALQAKLLARERQGWPPQSSAPGLCLMFVSATASGGHCGATARQIEQTGMILGIGPLSGLVPDGVATVTLHWPASNGLPAQSATSNVIGNVFVTSLTGVVCRSQQNLGRGTKPSRANRWPTMIWRSAQGKVIKVIPGSLGYRGSGFGFGSGKPGNHLC